MVEEQLVLDITSRSEYYMCHDKVSLNHGYNTPAGLTPCKKHSPPHL